MAEHPIQGIMNVTMDKIHEMVDANTIIGKAITTEDGTTILPVSKVSFGFASGGTDFDGKNAANKDLFGGGSGAEDFGSATNLILGTVSLLACLVFQGLAKGATKQLSVLFGLVVGYLVAIPLGAKWTSPVSLRRSSSRCRECCP